MKKITKFRDIPRFTDIGRYAVDYPINHLIPWIEEEVKEDGLQLNPDFQRGHVWTEKQQIAYVEFILQGGRTGRDIFLNKPDWHHPVPDGAYNDFVCVDGLQRLTALRRFIQNEIKVFGSYFCEYTDNLRTLSDTIRVHVNDLKTKEEVLRWYIEMNAGGTPHSEEEIERVQKMLDTLTKTGH